MRPRQQLCGELGSNFCSTVRSMGARHSEEQHQRRQNKEEVTGGSREEKCGDGNKETRGERWGWACVWDFLSQGIQRVTVPTVNVCAATVCRLCITIRTMTLKPAWGVK